jgi:hypothetical protein
VSTPTTAFVPGTGHGPQAAPQRVGDLSPGAAELARLLPGVYLARNEQVPGRPLLTLLEVLAAQLDRLEADVEQLAADPFVERASAPALRLLAQLVGARLTTDEPRALRAVVARTLHWRRRKGTLATLEDVLTRTSGWSAEVDEAYRSLVVVQDLAHPEPFRGRTAVLWDPVALADPLTRRAQGPRSPRDPEPGPFLVRRPDEDVEQTLRRVGGVDAGRYAASPRSVDLLGWARPDRAVIRTDRLVVAEVDDVEIAPGDVRTIAHVTEPTVSLRAFSVDPGGRDGPLVGRFPVGPPDDLARLTDIHEPGPAPTAHGVRHGVLTPTALAHDPAGLEGADSISVLVDGVVLVGPDADTGGGADPLRPAPVGPAPALRFADTSRPSPGEEWDLRSYALQDVGDVTAQLLPDAPPVGASSPLLLRTTARRRDRDGVEVRPQARTAHGGTTLALRLARVTGDDTGYRRDPDGTWGPLTPGVRSGPALTALAVLPGPVLVRLEGRPGGGLAVTRWEPDDPASRWSALDVPLGTLADADLPDVELPVRGPALGLVARTDAVVLVAPVRADGADSPGLGLWRIGGLDSTPTVERLDTAAPRRPSPRVAPSVTVDGDALVLHGGDRAGRVLDDTWTAPLTGPAAGTWRAHGVRRRVARAGGSLVPTPLGVVLLGGASLTGELDTRVHRVDLSRPRPVWERLADLPVPPGLPGAVLARADSTASGAGVEALVWADDVRPVRVRSDAARGWRAGAPEPDAPNPPADGEAAFVSDALVLAGPSPLPPGEVLVGVGARARLAFLPALDPDPGQAVVVLVHDDGSSVRWRPDGEATLDDLRLGAGRGAPTGGRTAPAARIGAPGRLAWRPLRLRQVSLGPWDSPLALTLPDAVGLDPRLGRVALRAEIADGALSVSPRLGRSAAIGSGLWPADLAVPGAWDDPADPVPPLPVAVASGWVSPSRAGTDSPDGTAVVARIGDVAATGAVRVVAVLGSPQLAPEVLVAGQRDVVHVRAADVGDRPWVAAEPADGRAVSLALHESLTALGGEDPDEGPAWYLTGLSLAGAVELAVGAGRLDLRWCTLAGPGSTAVRVAGAGHATALVRHSLPRARVAVRLVGCEAGVLEVPPWVDVLAVGCTFDAGTRGATAIAAPGASVRLRHCTVHGRTEAGVLQASSSAFAGPLVTDRPDLGWLRYCVSAGTGRPPVAFRSVTASLSFASQHPLDPAYLRLDDNNGTAVLSAAEHARTPGAHHELAGRVHELDARTDEFLPLALAPVHVDHAVADLVRTRRTR